MQRDVYAAPSSGDGTEYAAHLHTLQISSFLDTPQKWHFPAIINNTFPVILNYQWGILAWNILGTPKTNITSCKKGHNRCPLRHNRLCLSEYLNTIILCVYLSGSQAGESTFYAGSWDASQREKKLVQIKTILKTVGQMSPQKKKILAVSVHYYISLPNYDDYRECEKGPLALWFGQACIPDLIGHLCTLLRAWCYQLLYREL